MCTVKTFPAALILIGGSVALAQESAPAVQTAPRPLYKVTIVSRTTKAVNYGHRALPTEINFAGTPLLADARGKAVVEAKQGATVIDAHFSKVPPPTRFGAQYLTYVVWAISPDGRAQNLGELVLGSSNKGKLTASTSLQTFALIVTAEPHFSVPQPSDVVVMENVVSPMTVGKVEEVNATYELLPRKEYTYDPQVTTTSAASKPVSRDQYDAILALYQAQNAIQMAEADGAVQYSAERLARARELYEQARAYPKSQSKESVATARESTQVAEDARRIALKRAEADRIEKEEQRTLELKQQAEAQAQPARAAVAAESERARTERERTLYMPPPEAPPPPASQTRREVVVPNPKEAQARENRGRLLATLQNSFETVDSARGVIVTLSPSVAYDSALSDTARRIAGAVRQFSNLTIDVDAHSDRSGDTELTQQQADKVKQALASAGIPANVIAARGFGNSRPRGPNAPLGDGLQNRRIEIVIAGDSIGNIATWDRTYAIEPARLAQ